MDDTELTVPPEIRSRGYRRAAPLILSGWLTAVLSWQGVAIQCRHLRLEREPGTYHPVRERQRKRGSTGPSEGESGCAERHISEAA